MSLSNRDALRNPRAFPFPRTKSSGSIVEIQLSRREVHAELVMVRREMRELGDKLRAVRMKVTEIDHALKGCE